MLKHAALAKPADANSSARALVRRSRVGTRALTGSVAAEAAAKSTPISTVE